MRKLNPLARRSLVRIRITDSTSASYSAPGLVISRILDGMPVEKIAEGYEVSLDYVKQLTHQLKMDIEEAKAKKHKETGSS